MKKKTIWITSAAVGAVLVLGGAGVAVAVTDPFELASEETLTGTTLEKASKAALDEVGSGTVTDAETSDDLGHTYEVEVTRDNGAEVDVLLDEKFGVVRTETDTDDDDSDDDSAETGDSDETAGTGTPGDSTGADTDPSTGDTADTLETTAPLTEADSAAASAAALAAMAPGTTGTVTEVERSDDLDHAYEVEVTLPTGEDIDMELDESFTVLKVEGVPAA